LSLKFTNFSKVVIYFHSTLVAHFYDCIDLFFLCYSSNTLNLTHKTMLEIRPNCECCDKNLPPSAKDARICTFECTFCANCVENVLKDSCPNCGGNFTPRPIRPENLLAKHPPSSKRVTKEECVWSQYTRSTLLRLYWPFISVLNST